MGYGHAPFIASFFLRMHGPEVAHLAGFWGGILGFKMGPVGFLGIAIGLIVMAGSYLLLAGR